MVFDINKCYIQSVYCGNSDKKYPFTEKNIKYTSKGTGYECLKKGFGAAKYSSEKNRLDKNSLKNIKYVGQIFEGNFKKNNIQTINDLFSYCKKSNPKKIFSLLTNVFKMSSGVLHTNGFNSTLIFLYKNGNIKNLPKCKKV